MNLFPWLQDSISSINFDFLHTIIILGVSMVLEKKIGEFITLKISRRTLNNHEQLVTPIIHPDLMKLILPHRYFLQYYYGISTINFTINDKNRTSITIQRDIITKHTISNTYFRSTCINCSSFTITISRIILKKANP